MVEMLKALSRPPGDLFWSEPLALDSDFKKEDPLALDYLGQQVGLWLFPGFTTRTNRAQYYAVVLYGLQLAEKAIRKYNYPGDDETRTRLFERWERFWALATLESRGGELKRGDEDAMRGIRGATRAWTEGDQPLPLDFPLISRQSELAGLGAYLSSLRAYGLVSAGTLRVTPAAQEILDSFWTERRQRDSSRRYEDYALKALHFESPNVARSSRGLTLKGLGDRSRLSALVERKEQQERLWNAIFVARPDDPALLLAKHLIAAHADGVSEPESLLEGLLTGRWDELPSEVADKVEAALRFGRIAREILRRFDRAYGYVDEHGWSADFDAVAEACFPADEADELRSLCNALVNARDSGRFSELQYHGRGFVALLERLVTTNPTDSLKCLLEFHRKVQRFRRGAGTWLRIDQRKLVMQVLGYNGYKSEPGFPEFKLNVVRRLLADLGRLR